MTAESQKATRQPQLRKASSDSVAVRTSSTTVASRLPAGTPACGQLAQKPRDLLGLCSATNSTPFTADREALDETERHEEGGGPVADLVERR